jgi:hypothetical protein
MGKPDRIKISAEFHVFGNGFWIGMEAPVADNEDPIEEVKKTKALITASFQSMHPEVQLSLPVQYVDERSSNGDIVSEIESCKELKVLESYKFIVKKNKDWQKAYDKKRKELTTLPKNKKGKLQLP